MRKLTRFPIQINLILILQITTVFFPKISYSKVNLKNASYSDSWVDVMAQKNEFDFYIRRTYNSRSLYSGQFGYGWCFDFDTHLVFPKNRQIEIKKCGRKIGFTFNAKSISATEGVIYKSKLHNDGYITLNNGEYKLYRHDQPTFSFNLKGQLSSIKKNSENLISLFYKDNYLIKINDKTGNYIEIKYYKNQFRVKEIYFTPSQFIKYMYKGQDLIKVIHVGKGTISYLYDNYHNLIQTQYPDGSTKKVKYNELSDRVTQFKYRNNCTENYSYTLSKTKPKYNFTASMFKSCANKKFPFTKYEFIHKMYNEDIYLAYVKKSFNGLSTETYYHHEHGSPIMVITNNQSTRYEYFDNGIMKTKTTADKIVSYEYNSTFTNIVKISQKNKNKKTNKFSTQHTYFKYDKFNNLTAISNPKEEGTKIIYSNNGNISKIISQNENLSKHSMSQKIGVFINELLNINSIEIKNNRLNDKLNSLINNI